MGIWTKRQIGSRRSSRPKKGQHRALLCVEALEDRFCPSIVRAYDSHWALTGVTESISGPAASTTNWNFNPYPVRTSITEHDSHTAGATSDFAWHYDAGGSLETVTQNDTQPGGFTNAFEWKYINGTLATATQTETAGAGITVQWVYNNDGSIGSVTEQNTNPDGSGNDLAWDYDADGSLASATEKIYYAGGALEVSDTWTYSGGALSTLKEENYVNNPTNVYVEAVVHPDASLVEYQWSPGPGGAPDIVTEHVYNPAGTEVTSYNWETVGNGSQFGETVYNAQGMPTDTNYFLFMPAVANIQLNHDNADGSSILTEWSLADDYTTVTGYSQSDYNAAGMLVSSYNWMPGDPPYPAPPCSPSLGRPHRVR
jgi:hypothetical protein